MDHAILGHGQKQNIGTDYASFHGISHAQPPIGELRFKKPIPKKPWAGIFEANKHENCIQASLLSVIKNYNFTTRS